VLLVALTDPGFRLRGPRDRGLLPARRPCLRCRTLISAYAPASDRFCFACAPLVEDEPPRDAALYCSSGHLRAEFEVTRGDRSRASGVKKECFACKVDRNARRDRSAAAIAARELELGRRAA
jgi:hypothetical protein